MNYYTGIGSRKKVPQDIARAQTVIGKYMSKCGYTLRSGHASGSDQNFEKGAIKVNKLSLDSYLPWAGFNKNETTDGVTYWTLNDSAKAFGRKVLIKSGVLPEINDIRELYQDFHIRNVFQILGHTRVKSDFVVYYAPVDKHGVVKGGTRTAVNLAIKLDIPTYNLYDRHETKNLLFALVKADKKQEHVKGLSKICELLNIPVGL